jgi:hypothetical protein
MGLRSLVNEKYRIPDLRVIPCLCDIDQKGLWYFAEDLYLHRWCKTLARQRKFYVEEINDKGIWVRVGGRKNLLSKNTFLSLWELLRKDGSISRVEVENSGVESTSQFFALLSEISGVKFAPSPIRLYFDGYHPAKFLQHP